MDYITGIFVGGIVFSLFAIKTFEQEIDIGFKANKIKTQCEAELPRNKQCKIVIKAEVEQ